MSRAKLPEKDQRNLVRRRVVLEKALLLEDILDLQMFP